MDQLPVGQIGVVGAGTMGIGVSQLFAEAGYQVVLVDVARDALDRARTEIERNVWAAPLVRPDAPVRQPADVTRRILFTTDLKDLRDAGYVIENVTERWSVKRPVYVDLDGMCAPATPFGVNTSAIPITQVASVTGRAPRIVGTHFMNPAPLKPTVEVIRGYHTSDETVERTTALLDSVGKGHVVVADSPGFVTNRVLMMMLNEAVFLLYEGVSTADEIDRLFKDCFGHAMGPFETADLIGLDTVLLSLQVLYDNLHETKFRPCPLLRTLVHAGQLGRKTGHGFHSYESEVTRGG
jgi:3-hydroxybutyryl-CoA dehydrogenase